MPMWSRPICRTITRSPKPIRSPVSDPDTSTRGRGLIPRSAAQGPWRLSHDWLGDRKALRETPIDDGNLRFQRIVRRETLAPDALLS